MSLGKISSKTDILQDPFISGGNYTGYTNLVAGGQPIKYGFILAKSHANPLAPSMSSLITGSKQVILSLNPQSITQDEPAATQVTYTQNAGKYIERRGQVSKTITIQGTTGYTPTPRIPDALRSGLPASFIVGQEGPQSGMAQFLTLRALFREYWQTFSDDVFINQRANTLLIWINGKDDEHWVVEPLNFSMSRTSPGNKFTYQYSITMQTIAPVEAMVFDPDILTDFQKLGGIVAQVGRTVTTLTNGVAAIGNGISNLAGAARDGASLLSNLVLGVSSSLQGVASGLKDVVAIGSVVRGQMDDIKNSYMGAWGALLSISDYSKTLYGADPIPFSMHSAMTTIAQTLADLSARKELFSADFPSTWGTTIKKYSPNYGFGGFNKDLVAPLQKNGVQETTVLPGDTLQNIAVREMGNAERFMELVVLNQLKPPYLSPSQSDRAPNTLAPGDSILVPSIGAGTGARALVRTSVFTDPNFTTIVNGFPASNVVGVDTRGKNFRTNQWAGFTMDLVGPSIAGGAGYIPPAGVWQSTLTAPVTAGFQNTPVSVQLADFATLPATGYIIFDPSLGTQAAATYTQNQNLFDATQQNISTGTDTLGTTTGFVAFTFNTAGGNYNTTGAGTTTLASSTAYAYQGTKALLITCGTGTGSSYYGVRTVSIPVSPSTQYTFSVYMRGTATGDASVYIGVVDQASTSLGPTSSGQLVSHNGWSRYTYTFTTGAASSAIQVLLYEGLDTGYIWYMDAWQLEVGPSATTWNSAGVSATINVSFPSGPANPGYAIGRQVVYSPDGNLPANQNTPNLPFNGRVGVVVSNDATTLTLDTTLVHGPVNGDMVKLYLVRPATDVVQRKSSQEQLLGVDLKLVGNDLVVDPSGRLQLVDASDNVKQAIMTKILTRPGDLAAHPTFGLAFDPGVKVSPNLLFAYRVAVKQTLLSDARIDSVEQLGVVVSRDILQLTGYVVLVGSSQPYALDTRGAS